MSARSSAKSQLPATVQTTIPSVAASALSQIIERGARVQAPAVRAYVERLREHRSQTPRPPRSSTSWRSTTSPR